LTFDEGITLTNGGLKVRLAMGKVPQTRGDTGIPDERT
jgi:hypothetical protein